MSACTTLRADAAACAEACTDIGRLLGVAEPKHIAPATPPPGLQKHEGPHRAGLAARLQIDEAVYAVALRFFTNARLRSSTRGDRSASSALSRKASSPPR